MAVPAEILIGRPTPSNVELRVSSAEKIVVRFAVRSRAGRAAGQADSGAVVSIGVVRDPRQDAALPGRSRGGHVVGERCAGPAGRPVGAGDRPRAVSSVPLRPVPLGCSSLSRRGLVPGCGVPPSADCRCGGPQGDGDEGASSDHIRAAISARIVAREPSAEHAHGRRDCDGHGPQRYGELCATITIRRRRWSVRAGSVPAT